MTTYSLNVKLEDVDLITGVTVTFSGKVKGAARRTTVFSQTQTAFNDMLNFSVRGRGNKLTGKLSFSATEDATFIDDGVTYKFINPGPQRVRINSEPEPSEQISLNFTKILDDSTFLMQNIVAVDPLA